MIVFIENDRKKEEEEKKKELDTDDHSGKDDDDKIQVTGSEETQGRILVAYSNGHVTLKFCTLLITSSPGGDDIFLDESVKKEDIKDRKEVRHRSRQDSLSHRSSKERAKSHERRLSRERQLHHHRPLIPFRDRKFIRRPFIKRPLIGRPRKNPLTFHRIRVSIRRCFEWCLNGVVIYRNSVAGELAFVTG